MISLEKFKESLKKKLKVKIIFIEPSFMYKVNRVVFGVDICAKVEDKEVSFMTITSIKLEELEHIKKAEDVISLLKPKLKGLIELMMKEFRKEHIEAFSKSLQKIKELNLKKLEGKEFEV